MLKQLQATPHSATVKAVEEIYVTCRGAHPYYQCLAAGGNTFLEFMDNIQGYVSAAASNYNQAMQNQIDMVKNELRNEIKTSIQTSLSNQTNEIKNMMASLLQMNTTSTSGSGSLPSNTVANPKGKLKAITTRSSLVTDGPTVPTPPKSIILEEDEHIEEIYTDPDLAEHTIKVPPPPVQKHKPPSKRNVVVHIRDSPLPNIPYPSRMLKQKQQEKDEIRIQKFWHMFKQLHPNITLAEALVLMPKDLGKFLISCGFSKLKCKALSDLGASINLMPLSVWKGLGLPDLIPTRMTLELANPILESPILGRPFLRTARALIDVHGEEMFFSDGDERLTLNMKHDKASYSNHPHRESVNLINIFNVSSEDCLEFDIESDLKEIEFLLYQGKDSCLKDSIDQTNLANLDDYFVDPTPEMITDEHVHDYSSPPRFDVYDDDFLEVESDADNFYDDPFDSKWEKIKESKLLIDELDLPCDFLPYSEYDSLNSQDFSKDDDLLSTNNEDKVKEKQEKDKIGTKPDKKGSVEKPGSVEGQSQSRKQKKEENTSSRDQIYKS
nr:hypothetical protein [Tanacetum cinerariifolium]